MLYPRAYFLNFSLQFYILSHTKRFSSLKEQPQEHPEPVAQVQFCRALRNYRWTPEFAKPNGDEPPLKITV